MTQQGKMEWEDMSERTPEGVRVQGGVKKGWGKKRVNEVDSGCG